MRLFQLLALLCMFSCSTKTENPAVTIIPQPNEMSVLKGAFKMEKQLKIGINQDELKATAEVFATTMSNDFSAEITDYNQANIKLELVDGMEDEAYSLATSHRGIKIAASTPTGVFYGLQTARQLLTFAKTKKDKLVLPLLSISDKPEFGWRGMMLDESRYFFGVEKVKQMLDMMAMHKMNVFHWHLTDDPGWRIEIKQYPLLTTVGAKGNDIDPDAEAQFYTQEQIKDIVKYAADRHITVIPEIDMPGHAAAANRSYPEFSGGGSKSHPDFTFNPGYEGTYTYLTNILREVVDLFPSNYIHIGGDEVHFGNEKWNTDPHVRKLMKRENLKNLREVESYFIHRMADSVKVLGKTLAGWDEIVDFGLKKENSLVMWWRHDRQQILSNALEKDYDVVLCPRIPLYFDFDQDAEHKNGRKWGNSFSPLEMIHAFPVDTLQGYQANKKHIKGLQGNIWTERIQSEKRLDYMTYPRLSALAEAAWTSNENKDIEDFKTRLRPMLDLLQKKQIDFYNPFDPAATPEPEGRVRKR